MVINACIESAYNVKFLARHAFIAHHAYAIRAQCLSNIGGSTHIEVVQQNVTSHMSM